MQSYEITVDQDVVKHICHTYFNNACARFATDGAFTLVISVFSDIAGFKFPLSFIFSCVYFVPVPQKLMTGCFTMICNHFP